MSQDTIQIVQNASNTIEIVQQGAQGIAGPVQSVGITSTSGTLTVTGSTINISHTSGTFDIELPALGTAGTYGSSTTIPIITTDAYGRVTNVTTETLASVAVTSITGTANEVIASASDGAVTLSLPQAIATSSNPTFASVTATTFTGTATIANTLNTGIAGNNSAFVMPFFNHTTATAGDLAMLTSSTANFTYNPGTATLMVPVLQGTSGVVVQTTTASTGSITMYPGGASNSGYIAFTSPSAVQQGYIGYSSTSASANAGTIPMVAGTWSFTGGVASTSTSTGTIVIAGSGGLGVAGSIYAGGSVVGAGVSAGASGLVSSGGLTVSSGTTSLLTTNTGILTATTSLATPALVLNNTDATPYSYAIVVEQSGTTRGYWGADSTYAFRVLNGAGTTSILTLDQTGDLSLPAATVSSSTTTGALVVTGGVGIGGSVYVGAGINANYVNATTTVNATGGLTSGGYITQSINAAVSGAGTTQATGTALTKAINVITTCAAGAGVVLPTGVAGITVIVSNQGANACLVYPATGAAIDANATNVGMSLAVGARIMYICISSTQWSTLNATYV